MLATRSARVFISYKSENAQVVRAVAELLMSRDIDVWFAEYNLLTKDHLAFEAVLARESEIGKQAAEEACDALIRKTLFDAMQSCTHGLAFTNTIWSNSDFCQHEIRTLVTLLGSNSNRVIQVCLPAEPLHANAATLLSGLPTLVADPLQPDLFRILDFVLSIINEAPAPSARIPEFEPGCRLMINQSNAWASFDLGQFDLVPETIAELSDLRDPRRARQFNGKFDGIPLRLLVTLRPRETVLPALQSLLKTGNRLSPPDSSSSQSGMQTGLDDRKVSAELRREAERWYKDHDFIEYGCHLYWHHTGSGHLAMTYLQPARGSEKGGWHRFYVLILRDPKSGEFGELDLSFSVPFLPGGEKLARVRLLKIAHLLDEAVKTVNYLGRVKHDRVNLIAATVFSIVIGGLLGYGIVPLAFPWNVLIGLLIGLISIPSYLHHMTPSDAIRRG